VRTRWIAELRDRIPWRFRPEGSPAVLAEVGPKGSFISRDGKLFAGTHLIIDFRDAVNLDQVERIREALIEATRATNATLLHLHLHHFSQIDGISGVSGVAVLAESHLSIHTWPQYGYAALDLFMCGECNPYLAIPVLRRAFTPKAVKVQELMRGEVNAADIGP